MHKIGRKAAAHSPMPAVELGVGVGVVRAAATPDDVA